MLDVTWDVGTVQRFRQNSPSRYEPICARTGEQPGSVRYDGRVPRGTVLACNQINSENAP
jgi:hypothetical protein